MHSTKPAVSVIVPTCQRNDQLAICLDRLSPGNQTLPANQYSVIVTDDGGNSTAASMIASCYPWATWIEGPRRGPAANRNHGAKHASTEWLAFTDDDCLPSPRWLEEFYVHFARECDVLEGRTSSHGTRNRVDEECPINETGGYLWSCNFAIRKTTFESLGGFDEKFPSPALEDTDLSLRINKSGVKRMFLPEAQVFHPYRREKDRSFFLEKARSIAYFAAKHPEQLSSFSCRAVFRSFAKFLLVNFPRNMMRYRCKGGWTALRNRILLDFYTLRAIGK